MPDKYYEELRKVEAEQRKEWWINNKIRRNFLLLTMYYLIGFIIVALTIGIFINWSLAFNITWLGNAIIVGWTAHDILQQHWQNKGRKDEKWAKS